MITIKNNAPPEIVCHELKVQGANKVYLSLTMGRHRVNKMCREFCDPYFFSVKGGHLLEPILTL